MQGVNEAEIKRRQRKKRAQLIDNPRAQPWHETIDEFMHQRDRLQAVVSEIVKGAYKKRSKRNVDKNSGNKDLEISDCPSVKNAWKSKTPVGHIYLRAENISTSKVQRRRVSHLILFCPRTTVHAFTTIMVYSWTTWIPRIILSSNGYSRQVGTVEEKLRKLKSPSFELFQWINRQKKYQLNARSYKL